MSKLQISTDAFMFLEKEFELKEFDYVKFFVRLGGHGLSKEGFTLGIIKDAPQELGIFTKINDVCFYFEKDDEWFLENQVLDVGYSQEEDGIVFNLN